MSATAEAGVRRQASLGQGVLPLLALAVFINYVDRGNLATAAPLLGDELHLSKTQIGVLLSAFSWSYVPGQVLSGWLAEKINPYRTLALGLGIWALATLGMGLATGFVGLIMLRLILGLGESAAFPCSSKLLAQYLPVDRLGAANGLIGVGLALGPAFGTLVGGLMMHQVGWRAVFIVFGAVSMLWLGPWLWTTRHASRALATDRAEAPPSFAAILSRLELYGASLGHFSVNYSFYFVISWLPLYLVKFRGFSISHMAELSGLIYLVYAASSFATGRLSDRAIAAGYSVNRVRKTVILSSHVIVAACMIGCVQATGVAMIAILFAAATAFGMQTPTLFAIGQTLAGARAGGKWMGVQNFFSNIAGIVGPIITGVVVDRTGQFAVAFMLAAAMSLLGLIGWGLMIRKIEPANWAPA